MNAKIFIRSVVLLSLPLAEANLKMDKKPQDRRVAKSCCAVQICNPLNSESPWCGVLTISTAFKVKPHSPIIIVTTVNPLLF